MKLVAAVFTARDARSLAVIAVVIAASSALGWLFRKRIATLLTSNEWRVFFKLQGILVLVLMLLLMDISMEYPAEMFIYGRF